MRIQGLKIATARYLLRDSDKPVSGVQVGAEGGAQTSDYLYFFGGGWGFGGLFSPLQLA